HEAVDAPGLVQQSRAEVRVRGNQGAERLADGRALDLDQLLAAGRRAQDRRDADLAHADSQSSNAANRAGMTGVRPGRPGSAGRSSIPYRTPAGGLSPRPMTERA